MIFRKKSLQYYSCMIGIKFYYSEWCMNIADLKLLPHNIEAEKSLISWILIDPELYYTSQEEWVKEYHFYSIEHRYIWQAIEVTKSMSDAVLVAEELKKKNKLDIVWWIDYLYELSWYLLTTSKFRWYIDIVKENYVYRQMIESANTLIANAYDQKPIDTLLWDVKRMSDIDIWSTVVGDKVEDVITEYIMNLWKRDNLICKYWYTHLDNICQWYKKWQLIIIAGRPWVSKTATALNLADKVAKQWKNVLFFSLEMTKYELTERLLSSWTWIWARELWGSVNKLDEIANKAVENLESIENYWFSVYDSMNKFEEITNEIRKKAIRWEADVVFIDYLTLMRVSGKFFSQDMEVWYMTWELKQIAIKYWIAIVLLSQLNRNSAKEWKKPQMFDLRSSGNIEQDADNIYLLYRGNFDDDVLWKERVEMIIAKQRSGPNQLSILFGLIPNTMTIYDVPQNELDLLNY